MTIFVQVYDSVIHRKIMQDSIEMQFWTEIMKPQTSPDSRFQIIYVSTFQIRQLVQHYI